MLGHPDDREIAEPRIVDKQSGQFRGLAPIEDALVKNVALPGLLFKRRQQRLGAAASAPTSMMKSPKTLPGTGTRTSQAMAEILASTAAANCIARSSVVVGDGSG